MATEAVLIALHHIWTLLVAKNIPSALMGGLALSVWKHPRMTRDVDLLVAVSLPSLAGVLGELSASGIRPKKSNPLLQLGDLEFARLIYEPPDTFIEVQIDLLLAQSEYQSLAISRRVSLSEPRLGFSVDVLTCEDLLIHKLIAGRIIDLADAAALARVNAPMLDLNYLAKWIRHFRLESDFVRIWDEAFPGQKPHGFSTN